MQFEATTWDSTRAVVDGAHPGVHEIPGVAGEGLGGVELTGRAAAAALEAVPIALAGHATTVRPHERVRHRREHIAAPADRAGAIGAIAPVLDAVTLVATLAALRLWTPVGAAWLAITFLLVRDTASATPHRRINVGVIEDVGPLASRVAVSLLVLLTLTRLSGQDIDRQLVGILCLPAALLAGRAVACSVVRASRRAMNMLTPTVIIGAGDEGLRLAASLEEHPEYGCQPIGFMDCGERADLPLPFLGDPREIGAVVDSLDVRRVIIAGGAAPDSELVEVIRDAVALHAEIYVVPRFPELNITASPALAEQVRGIPLVHLPRRALRSSSWRLKRAFDVAASALALAVLGLPLLLIAAAIRLTSSGPVLYRQRRVGMDGATFELLKFRTMRVNSDGETTWSVRYDRRVTRIGRVLRRTGIDELPQLINVLRGEMSLVGPRPERPYFVDRFRAEIPGYTRRLRVPPGITGWAQVHGLRGDTSVPQRVQFDNHYVENWSIWRDIGIILRTVMAMKAGHG